MTRRFFVVLMSIMLAFALVLSSCSSTSGSRQAVTVVVNGEKRIFSYLEDAISSIPAGSVATVEVNSDVILKKQITLPQANVTIRDGGARVTISRDFSSADANRMFVLTGSTSLTICGSENGSLTIVGSNDAESRADRQVFQVGKGPSDSKVALFLNDGVAIQGNSTSSDGSVAIVSGKVVVNGAMVIDNHSDGFGGAFQLLDGSDFRIYSGSIQRNSALYGGGIGVNANAKVTLASGKVTGNSVKAEGFGGNVYIASGSQGTLLGGGISLNGGKRGDASDDLTMADGTEALPTQVSFVGKLTMDNVTILGKNVRFEITADVQTSTVQVNYDGELSKDEKLSMLTGVHAKDQYGLLRFEAGTMFNDNQNVRIKFYASPIKESQWGDCTYIEFPDGTNMLVDCGQDDTGAAIARQLWECGVYKIDVCLLTHYHSDHCNGFHSIFESAKMDVGRFISSSYIPSTGYEWVRQDLATYGGERVFVAAGDSFDLGGAHFEVLWPNKDQLTPVPSKNTTDAGKAYTDDDPPVLGGSLDMNSKSLVVNMHYGENRVLFTGDIYANKIAYNGAQDWDYTAYDNKNSEEHLVEQYAGTDALKADLMTAPHHGKVTSNSAALIAAVAPKYAVAMGTSNQKAVNARYEEAGAILYRTGSTVHKYSGTLGENVFAVLDGKTLTVTTGK